MIGDKLREVLKEKNMTYHELAERSGISAVAIARYCSNKRSPSVAILYKIADALGISEKTLLRKEREKGQLPTT